MSLALSALGFGALVFGLSSIGESASGHALMSPFIPIIVGVAGVVAFVFRQLSLRRNGGHPFIDMRIFRAKSFVVPLIIMTLVALNAFGTTLVLPFILSGALDLGTLAIGLFLVPSGAVIALVSALGGRIYDRFGPRPLIIPGAVIWTASIWFLSTLDDTHGVWFYLAGFLIMSAAQAMMWAPLTTLALSSLREDLHPYGSATFTTAQQLAGAAGGAVLISAYTIGANAAQAGTLTVKQAVSAGQAAFITAGIIAIVVVIAALFIEKRRQSATLPDVAPAE